MQILLNGKPREITDGAHLTELIDTLDLNGQRYAVEINQVLIPRSRHADHRLHGGDRVEIVQAIGGG